MIPSTYCYHLPQVSFQINNLNIQWFPLKNISHSLPHKQNIYSLISWRTPLFHMLFILELEILKQGKHLQLTILKK